MKNKPILWRLRFQLKHRSSPRRYYTPSVKRERKTLRRLLMLVWLGSFLTALAYGYYRFDRQILPLALAAADLKLKTVINDAIHTEIQSIILERDISTKDFYIQPPGANGNNMMAVNTVLVNDLCNASALAISERLSAMPPEPISIPMGMALGLDTLANKGPLFTFNLSPTGNALVNYGSKFDAVGINQVHFEVWLTVVATIRVINPVQSSAVTVTREVSLVDTVISGVVPDTYVGIGQ